MAYEEMVNSSVDHAMDQGRKVAEKTGQAMKNGYEAAQQYVEDKGLTFDFTDFVRREPWLAIAAALAIGYIAAAAIRRIS